MAFVEKTGKSVEIAVAEALQELHITADQAEIEVLEEAKKGFLGFGRRDAKVRVTVKEQPVPAEAEKPSLEEVATEIVEKVKEAAALAVAAVEEKAEEAKEEALEKAAEIKEAALEKAQDLKEEALAAKDQAVDSAVTALSGLKTPKAEAEPKGSREPRKYVVDEAAVLAAKEFLVKIFKAMNIQVAMEKFVNKNDNSVTFKLHGDDMGILIGKHGQTLDSLQYLTNLVANKNSSERVRIVIDVENYRDRRVETLTRLANRLADKVKRTGERVALEPMNPHERKIIHMALQNDRKVTTLSEGDEPYRRVVIELKK